MEESQICSQCNIEKPLSEYHKGRKPNGRRAECKDCRKNRAKENR